MMTMAEKKRPNEITKRKMARVRRRREAHGISQETIARAVNISREHYAKVEAGRVMPAAEIYFLIIIRLREIIREREATRRAA
jgi:transcriptional regulator with XRE-family HTH domain